MPLSIDHPSSGTPRMLGGPGTPDEAPLIVIGLVNNMPDAALEATEAQFSNLLQSASGDLRLLLRLTSLPEVPRAQMAREHIGRNYQPFDEFLDDPPDALIVTGAEPVAPELSLEPYWRTLVRLVDWSQACTLSSLWSCLAAHAAVQRLSGIRRRRLARKCCGVYEHSVLLDHPLTHGLTAPWVTPHSRWNELPGEALRENGYTILSESTDSGVNAFAGPAGHGLMIFLQGHPEYEETTLLKEYRRDVGRFVRGQQPHYPTLPGGCFSAAAVGLLADFQEQAVTYRSAAIMAGFPAARLQAELSNTWHAAAVALYANWLRVISSAKSRTHTVFSA